MPSNLFHLSHHRQRFFNPLPPAFFAQHFEQMIQARAVGIAGDGEARRVDERAGFHAYYAATFARRKPGASGSPCIKPSTLK